MICVPLGCIFSGAFTQPIGRRRAMQIVNIPMLCAWLFFYFSSNIYHLYTGLCLAGLSGGLMEAPVLTYVAEVTQPRFRGMLAATGSTCVILGVLSQFVMGTFMKWRTVALCSIVFPLISTFFLFFVPESPHWLIRKKRYDDAKKSLAWLRGWVPIANIEEEYDAIKHHISKNHNQPDKTFKTKMQRYMKSSFLYPYFLVCLTFFIGHFSGMTTLQTYAVQIFHTLKAPIDKYYATSLLGAAELTGTILCVVLVHYTGKRPIVFLSTVGCGLCFLSTAVYAYFLSSVPGSAVSNIVSNVSAVNPHDYYQIIPLNHSSISTEADIMTTTLMAMLENETFTEATTIIDDLMTESNKTSDTHFDNLLFSEFSANETYENHNYFDPDNLTINLHMMDLNMTEATAIPKDIILPIPESWTNKYLWIPLTLLIFSALMSHAGIRLIPWMLIGEVFPSSVRSMASGLSGGTGYMFGFLANKLFLTMLANLTLPGTFALYSAISIGGALLLYFILPETEGHTLVEIEAHFTGGKKLTGKNPKSEKSREPRHDRITATKVNGDNTKPPQNIDWQNWESNNKFQDHLRQMKENGIGDPLKEHRMGAKKKRGVRDAVPQKTNGQDNRGFDSDVNDTHL